MFKRFLKSHDGFAAIEFALIIPMMLVIFFGLLDITNMVSHNRKITSVAATVGDLVGQHKTSILQDDFTDYFAVASLIMKPDSDADVRIEVIGYRKVGSAAPASFWKVSNSKGPACEGDISTTELNNLMAAGNDLIVARSCSNYNSLTAGFFTSGDKSQIGQAIIHNEQMVTLRPRASLKLDCYLVSAGVSPCPN